MNYSIVFARSARRELEQLPHDLAKRILRRIEALAENPRPRGCAKIRGTDNAWRIRSGDYRVIYGVSDTDCLIDVITIRHRKDAYRD